MTERIHTDPAGFGIRFPTDWRVHRNVSGLAVVAVLPHQLGTRDNIGVIVEQTGHHVVSLEQYLRCAAELAPRHVERFRVVSSAVRGDAAGRQGVLEYTGEGAGRPLHFLAAVVMRRDRAFTATFTATQATYAEHLPHAEPVPKSLYTW